MTVDARSPAVMGLIESTALRINKLANRHWRKLVLYLPYAWLLLFFLAPFAIVLKISFADPIIARPPFTPLFDWAEDAEQIIYVTFDNFRFLFNDRLYVLTYISSFKFAFFSTLICLFVGYPMAYGIARSKTSTRNILLLLVILPFWTSFLLRVYAWMGILNQHGVANNVLLALGLTDQPIQFLYTDFAIYVGIVYSYLPFMILPLYANLERLELDLAEAAADLGSKPRQVFWDITLPLSRPGIYAGCLLVFIPTMGEYVIPALLGGPDNLMAGRVLYDEFFFNRDWPVSSAVAIVLLSVLVPLFVLLHYLQSREAVAQ